MKIHVGCGTVYLAGWLNVDLPGPGTNLARDRQDLVLRFGTTEDRYYGRHDDVTLESLRQGPRPITEYVCDACGSFDRLPCGIGDADEILARHSFEHLSVTEAHRALDECDRALRPGGILRLDVPDAEATLATVATGGLDRFSMRHLLGPRTSDYGYHLMGYTRAGLRRLVEEHGFAFVEEEPNIHCYPSVCLRFVKPPVPLPRDYALRGISLDPAWRILDVGPGTFPLHGENVWYLDRDEGHLSTLPKERVIRADLNRLPLPIEDHAFDFVFCSHVAEHVDDPVALATELSRIGKQGVLVTPHAFKDGLFNFEEVQHIWWFFRPAVPGGPVRAMRADPTFKAEVGDDTMRKVLCRLYRTGPNRLDYDQRILRRWFYDREPYLDVIVPWQGELRIEVIG